MIRSKIRQRSVRNRMPTSHCPGLSLPSPVLSILLCSESCSTANRSSMSRNHLPPNLWQRTLLGGWPGEDATSYELRTTTYKEFSSQQVSLPWERHAAASPADQNINPVGGGQFYLYLDKGWNIPHTSLCKVSCLPFVMSSSAFIQKSLFTLGDPHIPYHTSFLAVYIVLS